jgi:3-deoxy-manno-octulosonate cytidylyltransferase (CMP-KDO synthetase)
LRIDTCILIPARISSTRLPKKLLIEIAGLPVIEHTRRRALLNKYQIPVFVVTGDREIAETVVSFGGDVIITEEKHDNGTDRCAEAASKINYKKIIILQGDEILIDPKNIDSVIESCKRLNKKFILNAISKLSKPEELTDISIVKCLLSENNNVISLFRNTPLTCEKKIQLKHVYKVSGLFAYYKSTLSKILMIPTGKIQEIELIEQFKLIENDIQIKTIKINDDGNSLNTPTDLKQIRKILDNNRYQRSILRRIISLE